jgi:TPR repeat protein
MESRVRSLLAGTVTAACVAWVIFGVALMRDHDPSAIRVRAEAGDPESLFLLGVLHSEGIDVERDSGKAVRLWEEAAGLGHAKSMAALGGVYERGMGVQADPDAADRWYRKAADLGHAGSMAMLSRRSLEAGRVDDAAMWMRLASVGVPSLAERADSLEVQLDVEARATVSRRCDEWLATHERVDSGD